MKVEPLLTGHDVFSLSVLFAVWESKRRIRRILIKDRLGIALATAEPSEVPQFHEIRLEKIPRGRFPLFVEVTDGQGTVHGPETVGPVFPAPTDRSHTGGVPLPPLAVDVANDPEIRSLRATLVVGEAKVKAYERQRAILLDELTRLRGILGLPIAVASVFAAAATILGGVSQVRQWALSIPAAVVVVLAIGVSRLARRCRRLSRELEEAQARSAEDLADRDRALERLTALGVYGRVALTTGAGCRCGGHSGRPEGSPR